LYGGCRRAAYGVEDGARRRELTGQRGEGSVRIGQAQPTLVGDSVGCLGLEALGFCLCACVLCDLSIHVEREPRGSAARLLQCLQRGET
jgi:hypothetical protein